MTDLTASLARTMSEVRFDTYRLAQGSDDAKALALYEWNGACSDALWGALRDLEITLRNSLHGALARHAGQDDWWSAPTIRLTPGGLQQLQEASRGRLVTSDQMVSRLSFGFWVSLVGPGHDYEMRLWRPILRHIFVDYRGTRKQLHLKLDRLRTLRNRIAHHEPIFHRHLEADYDDALAIIEFICPDTAAWTGTRSTVPQLLAQRP